MTEVTDVGLEWTKEKSLGRQSDRVDTVAIGTDGTTESASDTSLGNEVYRAQESNANVTLVETGSEGQYEAVIRIKGGLEVSAGTTIREVGVFAGGDLSANETNTLIVRDAFSGVTIESGHTEEFTVPIDFDR